MAKHFSKTQDATSVWGWPWESRVERWVESNPAGRLDLLKNERGGWDNPDQPRILAAITGLSAETREGDMLPFVQLEIGFNIQWDADAGTSKELVFVTQRCRDAAQRLLAEVPRGRAEILVVTTERTTAETLDQLRKQVRRLGDDDAWPLIEEGPVFEPPPGVIAAHAGFSHYLVALNLHAKIAPLTSAEHAGPGWIVHILEDGDRASQNSWGTKAATFLDPLGGGIATGFVESRVTGLGQLFAVWSWLEEERHFERQQFQSMLQHEATLARPLLWPKTLFSWSRMTEGVSRARVRSHQLRALADDYRAAMERFAQDLETTGREVWVPMIGERPVPARERRRQGPLVRLVRDTITHLDAARNTADETWESAKAQQESYKVRLERLLGLAILALTVLQVIDLFADDVVALAGWIVGHFR